MKNLSLFIKAFILLLCVPAGAWVQAQKINAIDIEKATNSSPHNNMYTTLDMFAELNGIFYFNADDGVHGSELWRSDGTAAGTWLLKDINLGTASSNPDDIIVSGSKLYFAASDGVNGRELWISDGTAPGTHMVLDIGSFSQDANPSYLTDVNGTLYFVTDTYNGFRAQLWKTDGTTAGTVIVADFSTNYPYGDGIKYLTSVNGKVFFTARSFYSEEQLYVTDGTQAGTYLVKETNFFGADNPGNLTSLKGHLYFAADDGTGVRLWVSDGTDAGTYTVNNSNNIFLPSFSYDSNERPFTIRGTTLFFQGFTAEKGNELYKYNTSGTVNNIALVKDIVHGNSGSYPSNLTNINGTLFFSIGPVDGDAALWKSDGTTAGTVLVKDINPGGINYYYGFVGMDNLLMFAYNNGALGFELWQSNGSDAGTKLVKDILPGLYSSYPQFITYKHNTFLFGAYNDNKGLELWKSDGTTDGTVLVKDINHVSTASAYPFGFTASPNNKNKALFNARTYKYGSELWQSNGTDAGTKMVKDIGFGSNGSYPDHLINFHGNTCFFAYTEAGYYLGKTDGTAAGTSLFYQLNIPYGYVQDVAASDDLLYFTVFNYNAYRQELWRSDGTAAGTGIIKADLDPYYSMNPVGAGHYLFFVNSAYPYGAELWKSDGTTVGTTIVKDIYPGFSDANPFNLYNFNGRLYFAADYGYGPFLYTSDGTGAGTKVIKAALIQRYVPFAQAGNKLFFDAYSTIANGYELYATDGTGAGTRLVRDINNGPANSNPFALADGDDLLYFMADDGKHGSELWVSDGLKTGTHLVKNVMPGIEGSSLAYMVNVDDMLFFTIRDSLWQSDATKEGTHKVEDAALDGLSNINALTRVGDWLYFTGYKPSVGYELYTAKASDFVSSPGITTQQKIQAPITTPAVDFEAKLLTNPVVSQLRLSLHIKEQQSAQVTITDAAGRVIKTANLMVSSGTTILSYDAGSWAQGMYLIKVTTASGLLATLKAVK